MGFSGASDVALADSNDDWDLFLPAVCQSLIPQSLRNSSKKDQFLFLCDHPVLIDSGRKSFSLDKQTGKICFALSARDLAITWGNEPRYWEWFSCPDDSRFGEAVLLRQVAWLEIEGDINASVLSQDTAYAAFLVYKLKENAVAMEFPVEVEVRIGRNECPTRKLHLKMGETGSRRVGFFQRKRTLFSVLKDNPFPQLRNDGWLEAELGRFFIERDTDMGVKMVLREIKSGKWKSGLVVQCIEIRPRSTSLTLPSI